MSLVSPLLTADTVTLNSGEVVQGTIVFESESEIQVELSNAARTIFQTRTISKSDIKTIQLPTAEERAELAAYEALNQFQLNPNRELSLEEYTEGIIAFDEFLTMYPQSRFGAGVQGRIAQWKDEKARAAAGEAKFGNEWMNPGEKSRRVAIYEAGRVVQTLKAEIAKLEKQRGTLAHYIQNDEKRLNALEEKLASLPDRRTVQLLNNKTTSVPNEQKLETQRLVASYRQRLAKARSELAALDEDVNQARTNLAHAEQEHRQAFARVEESHVATIAAVATTSQPRPSPSLREATSEPAEQQAWYRRYWYWLAVGFCLAGLLLTLSRN